MRIVVAHSRLNTYGGGERVTLELLRHLGQRHDVTLWASDYAPAATYRELAGYPRHDLRRWQWPLAHPNADVVIAQTFGARFLALRHPATVCYVHTLRSRYLSGSSRPDLVARRICDRVLLRRAAAVVAPSQFAATHLERAIGRPVEDVGGGVSDEYVHLPEQVGDYALYVGRLAPEKGLDRLLAWSARIPLDLVIVGTGTPTYVDHLRQRAGPRVRWLGALDGDELRRAYQRCRMLVLTPYAEEFGLVALEAMAACKPVVAVAEGGLPELVTSGETGVLVGDQDDYERAVTALAHDDALCLRMGRAGRERARVLSWSALAARLEAICAQVART